MLELLKSVFLSSLIISIGNIYIMHRIYNRDIEIKNKRLYFYFFMLVIVTTLNCAFIMNSLRILSIILMLIPLNWYLFREDLNTSIATTITYEIVMIIAEVIYALILFLIVPNEDVDNRLIGDLLPNIIIGIISIILIQIESFKRLSNILIDTTNNVKKYELFVLLVVIILTINFLLMASYAKISLPQLLLLNVLLIFIYSFIIFKFVIMRNTYHKMYSRYNTTLGNLHEYEDMMDRYRISNHENKNNLKKIQAMLLKKEDNIYEFINSIVNDKLTYDEKLMYETNVLPEGGLRATVYSKLSTMKNKNIKFDFKVEKKVRKINLINLGDDIMLDICKIIGVYLDNAIEAVEDLDKKEIEINIYIEDDFMCIKVSNNYRGIIEVEKIDEAKYTTKTSGHGYGLTMVKELIDKSEYLKNERQINGEVFTQILKIKII